MITLNVAEDFMRSLPWPENMKRPLVNLLGSVHQGSFKAVLYEPVYTNSLEVVGPTPEGAIRCACLMWADRAGLQGDALQTITTAVGKLRN